MPFYVVATFNHVTILLYSKQSKKLNQYWGLKLHTNQKNEPSVYPDDIKNKLIKITYKHSTQLYTFTGIYCMNKKLHRNLKLYLLGLQ